MNIKWLILISIQKMLWSFLQDLVSRLSCFQWNEIMLLNVQVWYISWLSHSEKHLLEHCKRVLFVHDLSWLIIDLMISTGVFRVDSAIVHQIVTWWLLSGLTSARVDSSGGSTSVCGVCSIWFHIFGLTRGGQIISLHGAAHHILWLRTDSLNRLLPAVG